MYNAIPGAPPPRITQNLHGYMDFDSPLVSCQDCHLPCNACQSGPFALSLGCGPDWRKKADTPKSIFLDICHFSQTIQHNLEFPLPLPSDSCELIVAHHVFEHVHAWPNLLMECYRILRPGGLIEIVVPSYESINAYSDPTHVSVFTPFSMNFTLEKDVNVHPQKWPYPPFIQQAQTHHNKEEIRWRLLKPKTPGQK
jgi:SAM-dependent methyltransferase